MAAFDTSGRSAYDCRAPSRLARLLRFSQIFSAGVVTTVLAMAMMTSMVNTSGEDLAHRARLRQPHGDPPGEPSHDHDYRKLQEREEQQHFGLVDSRLHAIISP